MRPDESPYSQQARASSQASPAAAAALQPRPGLMQALFANAQKRHHTPPPAAPFVRASVPSPAPMATPRKALSPPRKPPSTCFPARESSLTHDPPKHFPYKLHMAARVISTDKFRTWGQPFFPIARPAPVRRPAKGQIRQSLARECGQYLSFQISDSSGRLPGACRRSWMHPHTTWMQVSHSHRRRLWLRCRARVCPINSPLSLLLAPLSQFLSVELSPAPAFPIGCLHC